ncbi:allantoate permease [Trichomonascus vanleenenianus]|uniref:allantoate permease n=1 Tax=Trichomonascus vanleenenianus TaxID=2268995 RepID=UPI003ECAAEF4
MVADKPVSELHENVTPVVNEKHVAQVAVEYDEEAMDTKVVLNGPLDKAAGIIGADEEIDASPEEIRKVVRKVDFAVLPFLIVCYIFYYVDKTTLSYSAIFGMTTDLNLHGSQYSWLSSVFYFGVLVWSLPTNYLAIRLPVAKYLGANICAWGGFLMIQAACPNFASLCVLRVLGGAAEACSDPLFMLITSMWYTRKEQPIRIGIWYCANGLGIAVGGLLGYGIGHIQGSLPSWKFEFLIIGALCFIWGILVFFFLPDNPVTAKFLNEREKKVLLSRLRANQTGIESKVFKWKHVKEGFTDIKIYLYFFIALFANIPNGGLSNFGTIIIKGFGFSTLLTTVMQVPNGVIVATSILIAITVNDKIGKNRRHLVVAFFMLPNIAGAFGLYFLPDHNRIGRLLCYYCTGPYNAAFVIFLSMVTGNVAGHTKKVLANAAVFIGVAVGNIAGPFFYLESQKPEYQLGMGSLMFSHFMELLLVLVLAFHLYRENKKRDAIQMAVEDYSNAFLDLTDKENPNFRYVY